jgi:hypothetical protein
MRLSVRAGSERFVVSDYYVSCEAGTVLFVSEDFKLYLPTYGALIKAQWCVEK